MIFFPNSVRENKITGFSYGNISVNLGNYLSFRIAIIFPIGFKFCNSMSILITFGGYSNIATKSQYRKTGNINREFRISDRRVTTFCILLTDNGKILQKINRFTINIDNAAATAIGHVSIFYMETLRKEIPHDTKIGIVISIIGICNKIISGSHGDITTVYSQILFEDYIALSVEVNSTGTAAVFISNDHIICKGNKTVCSRSRNRIDKQVTRGRTNINFFGEINRCRIDCQISRNTNFVLKSIDCQLNIGSLNREVTTVAAATGNGIIVHKITSIMVVANGMRNRSGKSFINKIVFGNANGIITNIQIGLCQTPLKISMPGDFSICRRLTLIEGHFEKLAGGCVTFVFTQTFPAISKLVVFLIATPRISFRTLFNNSVFAQTVINTFNNNVFGINDTVIVFQIPAVGETDFINTCGDVGTGQFSDVGNHGLAVFAARNVTAVNHDIAVGSQVFADGFPAGGVFCNRFSINDGVIQQKVSRITVAHHVDGIVFHAVFAIQIFVDLIQRIFSLFQNQDIGVVIKLFRDFVGIFHIVADDDKFTLFNFRRFNFRHRKSIGKSNNFVGVNFNIVRFNFDVISGIFGRNIVKVFNFDIFNSISKFFGKFGAVNDFALCAFSGFSIFFCFSFGFGTFVLNGIFRRRNHLRRFFIIRIICLCFCFSTLNRSSRSRRIHDLRSSRRVKQDALFQLLNRNSLLSQHLFRHGLFLPF